MGERALWEISKLSPERPPNGTLSLYSDPTILNQPFHVLANNAAVAPLIHSVHY
jgi:hypothetical protein